MKDLDTTVVASRLVLTLRLIVEQWPEITARDLLGCAQQLPSIMYESPLRDALNIVAAGRYIEDLVDRRHLPPWCGMANDEQEARLRAS